MGEQASGPALPCLSRVVVVMVVVVSVWADETERRVREAAC